MRLKWLIVAAFWALVTVAVAVGEHSEKLADQVVLWTGWVLMLIAVVAKMVQVIRYRHDPRKHEAAISSGEASVYPRWLRKFVLDERDAPKKSDV